MATLDSVIRVEFSHKIQNLETDLDRLALVAALATEDYGAAVRIRRRMAGVGFFECHEAGQ